MYNFHEHDLKNAKEMFPKAYVGTYGELRWKSNDRVPMADMLGFWVELGLITEDTMKLSTLAREEENKAFMQDYFIRQMQHEPTAEERFEMQAAFGKDVEVVDVITDKKYRT